MLHGIEAAAEALDPALRRANKSGVPIVLVDREVTSKDSYITFVTASDQALGRISAQWLAETLNFEGGRTEVQQPDAPPQVRVRLTADAQGLAVRQPGPLG